MRYVLHIALLFLLSPCALQAQGAPEATFEAHMSIETGFVDSVEVQLICDAGSPARSGFSMAHSTVDSRVLQGFREGRTICRIRALPPEGYSAAYTLADTKIGTTDENGCRFSSVSAFRVHGCHIAVVQDPVLLTVYLKWIGGSGEEEPVEVSLSCESGVYSGVRYVNEKSPASWEVSEIDPEGVLCNVSEVVRDTFDPDIIDCQGLLLRPGKGEECVFINTKIVKRIEMLNRYGKLLMIVLVLAVGLVAVRNIN